MNKIFTFGDGYATGHIWPEWPQILQVMLPDYQIVNTAGIGAGVEFLMSGLADHLPDMSDHQAIVQWPDPGRFDKLLQDQTWDNTIANDKVYHFNRVFDGQNREWWLSSASDSILEYHQQYVQNLQAQRRLEIFQTLVKHTLHDINCKVFYTSTHAQQRYSKQLRFSTTRQDQVQPSPLVHFYWLVEEILPNLDVQVNRSKLDRLEKSIIDTVWLPYNPDRDSIWQDIIKQQHL
jgi:hypothetical protein